MIMPTAYSRFHAATAAIRAQEAMPEPVAATGACACCGRDLSRVEDAGVAIMMKDKGTVAAAVEPLCTTCYTPRIAAPHVLGVERLAGGKPDKPVGGKLGMLMATGGVIGTDNVLHLAMPPKNIKKFSAGSFGQAGQLHATPARPLLLDQLANGALDPDAGFVYIANFGRRATKLMADLRVSCDLGEIWANSDTGPHAFDLAACHAVADWARAHDMTRQVTQASFWRPIQNSAKGRHDAHAVEQWAESVENAMGLLACLPPDPAQRMDIHLTLTKRLEA